MCWFFSESASNFGTFFSGVGAIVLAGLGIYAARSMRLWKNEKRQERKSELAKRLLKKLNSFEIAMDEWLKYIWFVYHQDYELTNYLKTGYKLLNNLGSIKIDSEWLEKDIPNLVKTLESFIKNTIYSINILHFANATKEQKMQANDDLSAVKINAIKKNVASIREKLKPHVFFEN